MGRLETLLAQVRAQNITKGGRNTPEMFKKLVATSLDAEDRNNATMTPGRAIGGTGATGLNSNDGAGYADMLNEQQAYLGLDAYLQGKPAPTVKSYQQPDAYSFSPATGKANYVPSGTSAQVGGDELMRGIQSASLSKARNRYEQGGK